MYIVQSFSDTWACQLRRNHIEKLHCIVHWEICKGGIWSVTLLSFIIMIIIKSIRKKFQFCYILKTVLFDNFVTCQTSPRQFDQPQPTTVNNSPFETNVTNVRCWKLVTVKWCLILYSKPIFLEALLHTDMICSTEHIININTQESKWGWSRNGHILEN